MNSRSPSSSRAFLGWRATAFNSRISSCSLRHSAGSPAGQSKPVRVALRCTRAARRSGSTFFLFMRGHFLAQVPQHAGRGAPDTPAAVVELEERHVEAVTREELALEASRVDHERQWHFE